MLGKRPEPHPLPNPRLLGRALSPRRLWGSTFTDGVSEEGSECGAGRGSPGFHPSAGGEAPAHKASGWVVRRPRWGAARCPGSCTRRAVAAVPGLEVHRAECWAQRGKAPPFPGVLSPGLGRWGPQGGVTGGGGLWSPWGWYGFVQAHHADPGCWGTCLRLDRGTQLWDSPRDLTVHPRPPTCCTRCFSEPVCASPGCRLTHPRTMDTHT